MNTDKLRKGKNIKTGWEAALADAKRKHAEGRIYLLHACAE